MAFGTIAKNLQFNYCVEDLVSPERLLEAVEMGIEEIRSLIEGAAHATTRLSALRASIIASIAQGNAPAKSDLESLSVLADKCSYALSDEERALDFASSACNFQLGNEMELENGDMYRDGVLVETLEESRQRCVAEREDRRALISAEQAILVDDVADKIKHIDWTVEPADDAEKTFRASVLDSVELRCGSHGFPGQVYAAAGVTNDSGDPITHAHEAESLAVDARKSILETLRIMDARHTRELVDERHAELRTLARNIAVPA